MSSLSSWSFIEPISGKVSSSTCSSAYARARLKRDRLVKAGDYRSVRTASTAGSGFWLRRCNLPEARPDVGDGPEDAQDHADDQHRIPDGAVRDHCEEDRRHHRRNGDPPEPVDVQLADAAQVYLGEDRRDHL